MTREKAIKILECMAVDLTGALADTKEPLADVLRQRLYAIDVAQAALTPPTQEQMERVWPGCERCTDPDTAEAWSRWGHQYCHHCGRPLTPEAWEEQRKRWEALWSIS